MNEQVNVHESTASVTFVSAKKRKIRMPFDMVICLVLVFVLVSALTALFVVRRHADVVIGGMQAVEVIDRTNTEGVPVTFESTVEEDGSISTNLHYSAVDTLGASSSSYELPEEVRNVVSVQKIGETYVLTHADGTTTTFTDDNFGYVEVDLDEVMGALPAVSEEDAQFYILACNVPTAFDIQSIVTGFTGSKKAVEADFTHGWITVFLNECKILPKDKIDWMAIRMALPYGIKI